PQSVIVEKRHLPECVIAAAMRIAAEVVERLQFSEDGDVDLRAQSLLEFIQRGDFITQQKRAQCIGAEGCWAHNVIVPIERGLLFGTITNRKRSRHCISICWPGQFFFWASEPIYRAADLRL